MIVKETRTLDLGAGYRLVLVKSDLGEFASLGKDKGSTILWTGLRSTLKATVDKVAHDRSLS